jgi:hypothetical protein
MSAGAGKLLGGRAGRRNGGAGPKRNGRSRGAMCPGELLDDFFHFSVFFLNFISF